MFLSIQTHSCMHEQDTPQRPRLPPQSAFETAWLPSVMRRYRRDNASPILKTFLVENRRTVSPGATLRRQIAPSGQTRHRPVTRLK